MSIKYLIKYKDINENDTKIEILEDDYIGSIINLTGSMNPLEITMDSVDDKFEPVIGTGCDIEVIADDIDGLQSLYSNDIFAHQVNIYKNDILFWNGYINSEVYNEGYASKYNNTISLSGNDGLNILNRIKYLDEDGNHYTGLISIWDLLKRLLNKMQLIHENIFVALDKYPSELTPTESQTPFHLLMVNQDNYYDESDEPLDCREVLESILKPFGVRLFKTDNSIHIMDIDYFSRNTFMRKQYDSSFEFVSNNSVDINFNISNNEVVFSGGDQTLDFISGYNQQTLIYSPYTELTIFESVNLDEKEDLIGTPIYTLYDEGIDYYRITGLTNPNYTLSNGATIATHCLKIDDNGVSKPSSDEDDLSNFYIFSQTVNTGAKIISTFPSITKISKHISSTVKITFDVFVETRNSPLDTEGKLFQYLTGHCYIKLGDKYLAITGTRGHFVTVLSDTPYNWSYTERVDLYGTINDVWTTCTIYLPRWTSDKEDAELIDYDYTSIQLEILNDITIKKYWDVDENQNDSIKALRFKNIEAVLVDGTRSEIIGERGGDTTEGTGLYKTTYTESSDDDIEITATLNDKISNDGSKIELIHGDSANNNCTDKGAFYDLNKRFTELWKKENEANNYPITSLLLRSVISNYRTSSLQISGTLDTKKMIYSTDNKNTTSFSFLSTISDTNYMGTKRFMFMGGTYNDIDQYIEGEWLEVYSDDLTIEDVNNI